MLAFAPLRLTVAFGCLLGLADLTSRGELGFGEDFFSLVEPVQTGLWDGAAGSQCAAHELAAYVPATGFSTFGWHRVGWVGEGASGEMGGGCCGMWLVR